MTEHDNKNDWFPQAKVNVAIAMSAILITTSAITLPLMSTVENSKHPALNDIFWLLGLGAVLTSAFLIDWLLDKAEKSFKNRLRLMNYGYLAFSLIVSFLSIGISAYFYSQEIYETSIYSLPYLFFILGGISVFVKMMTYKEDKNLPVFGIFLFFSLSYCLIQCPKP